jgi:hypothetical protein
MPHQYSIFESTLKKRGRRWRWRVGTVQGEVVMEGSENSRAAARYKSDRAIFLDPEIQNTVARPRQGLGAAVEHAMLASFNLRFN